ncbi:MAG TPA: DUF5652 family protein [Patescibacteria group bacterium]|nr:DUF5652 family protein [Patescibacteria group bacterium]
MNFNLPFPPIVLFILFVWSIFWNGLALWHAAKNNQKNWFVVLLVIHTAGILELLYLFIFAKKKFKIETIQFWKQ